MKGLQKGKLKSKKLREERNNKNSRYNNKKSIKRQFNKTIIKINNLKSIKIIFNN